MRLSVWHKCKGNAPSAWARNVASRCLAKAHLLPGVSGRRYDVNVIVAGVYIICLGSNRVRDTISCTCANIFRNPEDDDCDNRSNQNQMSSLCSRFRSCRWSPDNRHRVCAAGTTFPTRKPASLAAQCNAFTHQCAFCVSVCVC